MLCHVDIMLKNWNTWCSSLSYFPLITLIYHTFIILAIEISSTLTHLSGRTGTEQKIGHWKTFQVCVWLLSWSLTWAKHLITLSVWCHLLTISLLAYCMHESLKQYILSMIIYLNPNLTCKHHCSVNRNERFGIHPRTKQMPIFISWWQDGRAERGLKTFLYKRALT